MPNAHFHVKFCKFCKQAVSILPDETKALLERFCIQPMVFGWRQNSSSGSFASWGKIKIHDVTLVDQDWIGLVIFKNFADQDWIGFNFVRSGLDSDWKISQSTHLWRTPIQTDSDLTCSRSWDQVKITKTDWKIIRVEKKSFFKITTNHLFFKSVILFFLKETGLRSYEKKTQKPPSELFLLHHAMSPFSELHNNNLL